MENKDQQKFCKNCGVPIKEGEAFCGNCGTKVDKEDSNKKSQKIAQNVPQKRVQVKKVSNKKSRLGIIASICVLLLLVCGGAGFYFYNQHNDQAAVVAKRKSSAKKNNLDSNNKPATKNSSSKKDNSKLRWMLMGYMAYARKNYEESQNVGSTSELVDAVVKDFNDGTLTATQKSDTSYTISNDYGAVNVVVEPSDVKVTNDGTTVTSKSDLKQTFNKYTSQMAPVIKKINNTNSNDNKSSTTTNSKKTSKDNKNNAAFSDEEMVVAAYVDNADGNSPQDKINTIKSIVKKYNNRDPKLSDDDFLTGLYTDTYKGQSYYSIASKLSTTQYEAIYLNGDGDQYAIQEVAPGMGLDEDSNKKNRSKKDLVNKYKSYKQDLDEILNQLKDNKSRMSAIMDKLNKNDDDNSKSNDNDSDDSDHDSDSNNSNQDEDTNDSDEDVDVDD